MRKKIFLSLIAFLFSCGGGSNFSTSKNVSVSASISAGYVDTGVSDYKNNDASLTLSVSSSDIFRQSVYFSEVDLRYRDLSGKVVRTVSYPLGFSLETGQSKTINITLFSVADKLSAPYVYLNPVNPTTFGANYAEEILAVPVTLNLGQGECHMEQRCQIQNGQQVCQDVEVCRQDFSGTFSQDITVGTCKVVAGNQVLEEKDYGILSGDGSGIVSGRDIKVSFNQGVSQDVYVVAQCLSSISPLSHPYLLLKLVYGDSLYEVTSGGLIRNSSSLVVGQVDQNGNVKFYIPLGAKSYPLVAFYYYGPTLGGELLGYGDGGSTYRMKTRYSPVDASSVKVVADDGRGFSETAWVQWVDSSTGEITFTFPRPVPQGIPIYAQYRLTDIFQTIEVIVKTSVGDINAGQVNLRVRQ